MRIDKVTPVEAAQLTGVKPHRIWHDVRSHAKRVVYYVAVNEETEAGRITPSAYDTGDLVREYKVRNAMLKLALIELDRLIAKSRPRPRLAQTR